LEAMTATGSVSWHTVIGNLKKWKEGEVLQGKMQIGNQEVVLQATLEDREQRIVRFQWEQDVPFVSLVEAGGEVPLPPYLNRKAVQEDRPRYQTIYSRNEGAVAAPTAGLHFTEDILSRISEKGIRT